MDIDWKNKCVQLRRRNRNVKKNMRESFLKLSPTRRPVVRKMAMVGMRMFHSNGKENHVTKLFRLSERLRSQYTSPIHDKHDYVFVHSYTSFTHDQTTTYLLAHTNLTSKRWIRIQLSKFQKTVIPRTFVCPHLGKIS